MDGIRKTAVALLLLPGISLADQVLWNYSLAELPPGWAIISGEWEFLPDGARSDAVAEAYETDWNELWSDLLILPGGTDSISIAAEQYSVTWRIEQPNTFAFTRMVLNINGESGIYWNVSLGQTDSLPIFVVPGAAAGDTVRVILFCTAVCDPPPPNPPPGPGPQATSDFHIWNFVVTAYGDIADLEPATWASIKTGQIQGRREPSPAALD